MKWYSNQTQCDCGPIAALNALRHHGEKLNPRSSKIRKFKKLGNYNSYRGMSQRLMCNALRKIGFRVAFEVVENVKDIEDYLNKGHTIILNYEHGTRRHYIYITGQTKNFFIVVNEINANRVISRRVKSYYTKDKVPFIYVLKNYKPN